MRIIGVMSGSSLDGLDIASVKFKYGDKLEWELEYYETVPLERSLKADLSSILDKDALQIAHIQSKYSEFVAESVINVKRHIGKDIDYLSIHGHTILHLPEIATSWQLLNGGQVSGMCQTDVITDFRNQDMTLGGQGTPMAVIADRDLFAGYDFYLNLGGIANLSYYAEGCWHAYDFAPCNQVNDYFAKLLGQNYDKDGLLASQGHVNGALLEGLLNQTFIKKNHPKSLDNTWIKEIWIPYIESFNLLPIDVLNTYAHFLKEVIKKEVAIKEGTLFITGGGTKNSYFTSVLKDSLSKGYACTIPDSTIIDYKESILMAYMAFLRVNNRTNFISSSTGASRDCIGGAWYTW